MAALPFLMSYEVWFEGEISVVILLRFRLNFKSKNYSKPYDIVVVVVIVVVVRLPCASCVLSGLMSARESSR